MDRFEHFSANFCGRGRLRFDEISSYFHTQGILNDTSIKAQISKWTAQGKLSRVEKGVYEMTDGSREMFRFFTDEKQRRLTEIFIGRYPELKCSVWHSGDLNRLAVHQHFRTFYIFETEADVIDETFYLFRDNGVEVYVAHDGEMIHRYMYDSDNPVVIKKLLSRSPLTHKDSIPHPAIEKVMVDIRADISLFDFFQRADFVDIYKRCFDDYVVNTTKLLNYAERRGCRQKIESLLEIYHIKK